VPQAPATLLIARLDRLARSVAFIANLMESGVDFVAVDMPTANRFNIHIIAAVAEHEREVNSIRTKAALTQAKARGKRLGNPRPLEALKLANAAKAIEKPAQHILDLITGWQAQGKGLRETARELNRLNIRTPRGCEWYASTVRAHLPEVGTRTAGPLQ
jgi:DNA invertase Pin-like site-specific DNA recombinase